MTQADRDALLGALKALDNPDSGAPFGDAVKAVAVRDGKAAVEVELGYPARGSEASIGRRIEACALGFDGIEAVAVDLTTRVAAHAVQGGLKPLDGVRNVLAVASGKGGVGKSTVAANLALALAAEGARVGVLDADIYGPSQPRMLGLAGKPQTTENRRILPFEAHGLQAMSIGVLVDVDQAMIWRGPMATQALQQMLAETLWDGLDYLVIDLPPGTGDVQLTLAQRIPVAGSIVITTPQDVALDDVRRAVAMFRKVKVPVLGVVENMSTHVCSACGHEEALFGHGGGARIAEESGLPLLGQLPLDAGLGRSTDEGAPSVVSDPEGPMALRFREIARRTAARLALQDTNTAIRMPKITISD